jgi:hypothetical protein
MEEAVVCLATRVALVLQVQQAPTTALRNTYACIKRVRDHGQQLTRLSRWFKRASREHGRHERCQRVGPRSTRLPETGMRQAAATIVRPQVHLSLFVHLLIIHLQAAKCHKSTRVPCSAYSGGCRWSIQRRNVGNWR